MKTSTRNWLVGITTTLLASASAFGANFTKGNLVVLRSGDGAAALGANATPIAILELATNNGAVIHTVSLPTSGASSLTDVGNSSTEGMMTLAPASRALAIPGYNVDSGFATPSSATAVAGRRSVGVLDQSGNFTIGITATSGLTGNNRAAAMDGAGNFYEGLSSGIQYVNVPATLNTANSRGIDIRNGNLYYVTAGGSKGIYKFTGLPTSASTAAQLIADGATPNDFAIDDAETTIYMADANAWTTSAQATASGGIRKYTYNGTAWVHQYTIRPDALTTTGAASLVADFSGPNPVIYTISGTGANNEVTAVTDTGASSAGTQIALAGNNFAFRSIRFAPYGAPSIATQPGNQTVNEGSPATFSVTLADGTDTNGLTYIWKDNLNNVLATHSSVSLSDSYTFSSPTVSGDNGKLVHVEATNSLGSAISSDAMLTVNAAGVPPAIDFDIFADKDPIYAGQTVTFEVDATGSTPMTYSWSLNGTPLTSGGNVTIVDTGLISKVTISGITTGQAGTLYCGITNGVGGTNSTLTFTVTTPAAPSVTAMNPTGGITNNAGANRVFTVGAGDDSGVLTYQWKRDSNNLTDGAHANSATIVGATTPSLTLSGVLGADAGTYHCIVSNAGGSTDSSPTYEAYLSVVDPVVTAQPTSRLVTAGNTLTVSVGATGTGMTYQWSKDGNPLSDGGRVSGATTSALTVSTAQASDTGVYTVAVNSTFGAVSTDAAKVVVADTTAQPLYASNIVVLQRGDGAETLVANGNSLFLLQYDSNGNLVSAFAVPNTGANSILQAGSTPTEGWLTKSADGQLLCFAGYKAQIGNSSSLPGASGTTINRAAATIDKLGTYTLAAYGTNHSNGNIRSAVTDGLGNFWTAGSVHGIEFWAAGGVNGNANGAVVWNKIGNLRVINIFNGNLYQGSSTVQKLNGADPTSGAEGVYAFSGLPTTFITTPNTNEWTITIPTNTLDFGIYDFAINPADNIAYISDDQAFSSPDQGGIHRYDKVAGVWTYSYRFGQASRGLTVDWSGVNPTVYATTPIGGATNGDNFVHAANDVVKVVDTGANSSITRIATAVGGSFAGIRTAPGTTQTITFPALADAYSCSGPIALNATASSGLPVTYTILSGPATLSGNTVVITTPLAAPATVTVLASQAGDGTYSAAANVTQSFTVSPSAPNFTIAGSNPANVECHGSYTDAGATAADSCGTTLTVSTTGTVDPNTVGSYTITYSATDSEGNVGSATRTVTVADSAAPVVTLNGSAVINLCLNEAYTEAGATASDDCAGTLPANASGTVDTSTVGSYTITYTANDGANNGVATRVVNVNDCTISIIDQPQSQFGVPEGTPVTLSVTASGSGLTYQWYENNTLVPGATGASYSFNAHTNAVTLTNNTYYVVVANNSTSVPSANAVVTTIADKKAPVISKLTSPLANSRADTFTITGQATDATGGNVVNIVYQWDNANGGGISTYTNLITGSGINTKRDFSFAAVTPPAGTNTLTIWAEDLAGRRSNPKVVKGLFARVIEDITLNISGDGNGTVSGKTKAPNETVPGLPLTGGATPATVTLHLYRHQLYTISFAADIAGTAPVQSVVSNAPGMTAQTDSKPKVSYTFKVTGPDTWNVSFNRNRFVDMAGNYNAVFTSVPANPTKEGSRFLHLTLNKARKVTGYLLDAGNVKTVFTPTVVNADGSVTITAGTISLSGSFDWTGSEDPNGVKQFVGTSSGDVAASFVADKEDKAAIAIGQATMQIPPVSGVPAGTSVATLKSVGGNVSTTYLLGDDEKHTLLSKVAGSRSGNLPQWAPNLKTGGLLFGTINASNSLTGLTANDLSWIRPPTGNTVHTTLLPAGFTNAQFAAVASPYDPTILVNGNFLLNVNGGGIISNIVDQPLVFSSGKILAQAGHVKTAKVDANGKLTVTFLDGSSKTSITTAYGAYLQNTNRAAGFFIRSTSTDDGVISLTPAP